MPKKREAKSSDESMTAEDSLENTIIEKLVEIHSQFEYSHNDEPENIVKNRMTEMQQAIEIHIRGQKSLRAMRDSAPRLCSPSINKILTQINALTAEERGTLILTLAAKNEPPLDSIFQILEASLAIHMLGDICEAYMYMYAMIIDKRARKPKAESLALASKIAELREREKSFGEIAKLFNTTMRPSKPHTDGSVRQSYNRFIKEKQASEKK